MNHERAGISVQVFIILVCAVVIIGAFWYALTRNWSGVTTITAGKCIESGGEIVNTFSRTDAYPHELYLGDVEGLKCPCVCVLRDGP